MKKHRSQKPISYFHWFYRVATALFIAFYLNTPTQYKSFFTLFYQRNYQEAVIFSFLSASLVIWGVHYSTLYLDKRLPWEEKPVKRTLAQIFLGLLMMILITYIAVRMYFWLVDGDMVLSDYMVLEFPIVQAGIAMLNMIYFGYYILMKNLIPQHYDEHLKGRLGQKTYFIPVEDIMYLRRSDKLGCAVLKNNKEILINYKMTQLEELLDQDKFFRANRSLMVSMDIVIGYKPVKNMQCVLILSIPVPPEINLQVTRERTEILKKMLKQREAKPTGHEPATPVYTR